MVASTALSMCASDATITGSFPPHSSTTGVICVAQAAATNFAVRVDPVKESLLIAEVHSAFPVSPNPVIVVKIPEKGAMALKLSSNKELSFPIKLLPKAAANSNLEKLIYA